MSQQTTSVRLSRRDVVRAGAAIAVLPHIGSARATPAAMAEAIRTFTGGAAVTPGRVRLEVPQLVENGNSVALSVQVESPMSTLDFVKTIAVFNERNPQPQVAVFTLSPANGRAVVSTRMRLGDTQQITAIAAMNDGSFWSAVADVVVTLPACVEDA
jgi:sulfur-oxidizing protein SoxY